MSDFSLHPQLAADTVPVIDLPLCRVLLMTDANYPWLVLVPRRMDARELHRLPAADQQVLMAEMTAVADVLEAKTSADKMNVASLGNMVPQLHVHVIARFEGDVAWPGPVWGAAPAATYDPARLARRVAALRKLLGARFGLAMRESA
ncbi:MAG: HIT domain-containing protein [Alphaproteobacteria bacterium]|nr:MAG: HIT domain-containing protein [Alphaproteobacteria bacterium]